MALGLWTTVKPDYDSPPDDAPGEPVNLRDLKYFIALAEHGHFGRAADACCVSQPTLSGQLRKLEAFLGVTLFERTNRAVQITPIGRALLDYARLAVEQADTLTVVARAHRDPLAGPLRLGVIPTLGPYLMPLLLLPLRRSCPCRTTGDDADAPAKRVRQTMAKTAIAHHRPPWRATRSQSHAAVFGVANDR